MHKLRKLRKKIQMLQEMCLFCEQTIIDKNARIKQQAEQIEQLEAQLAQQAASRF